MKKVIFKNIAIKNFLSVGEEAVSIDFKTGLNIITGNNLDKPERRNAVGKSTIADAVYFAIFGDTLRDIKKDLIVNNITGGKTCVELEFEVQTGKATTNCKIIRTLTPTKVFFYEDGVDKTRDSISNTTKYICDLINASPAIFQNCVIMTVNNAIPFMAKSKIDKRKFIEDIFGMEVFGRMLSVVRQEYLEVKRELEIRQGKLEELKNTQQVYTDQRKKLETDRVNKKKLYLKRRCDNQEELERLNKKQQNIPSQTELDVSRDKLKELEDVATIIDNKIGSYLESAAKQKAYIKHTKDTMVKIGTSEDTCPVCLQSMEEHDHEKWESEKQGLKLKCLEAADVISQLDDKIKSARDKKLRISSSVRGKIDDISSMEYSMRQSGSVATRITQLEQWQSELDVDISDLESATDEFDVHIDSNQLRIAEFEKSITESNREIARLDVIKFIVSEEGVKSYIVNKLLELLNSKLCYYLEKLQSNSICMFNEYFEEEIMNDKGKICSYFNFSGAERKSIDLACLFAFSDLRRMQNGVSYNIAMYDELFDSSFDDKGIELITDILHERVEAFDECAIVISHRKESLKAATGEVIFLEKEKGLTRRVDFADI